MKSCAIWIGYDLTWMCKIVVQGSFSHFNSAEWKKNLQSPSHQSCLVQLTWTLEHLAQQAKELRHLGVHLEWVIAGVEGSTDHQVKCVLLWWWVEDMMWTNINTTQKKFRILHFWMEFQNASKIFSNQNFTFFLPLNANFQLLNSEHAALWQGAYEKLTCSAL